MSVTKDGFYNIEGKVFEVVHGVEGDCLVLGDEDGGTRISGPKPWGGGQVTKRFVTQEKYGPIERLEEENAKLRDAMFSDAKKHALHHMDEDELRIWATQQAETIDGLRDLCKELYHRYWDVEGELFIDLDMDELTRQVRDFGIEAE